MSRSGSAIDRRLAELFRARPDGFVSGEELSVELAVSRTAVWKHVRQLRALGYAIDSVPSRGYRLRSVPDILLPAEIFAGLTSRVIGRSLCCLADTDSTNAVAARKADGGAEEGTVVVADTQTMGKGRLGRRWESPPGVNLYCSVVLRPALVPMEAPRLTFLSAVAVCRAIEAITSLAPRIKWPNDILLNGRKVAGLLNELSAETERVRHVVLGIGINVNMRPEQFPSDLRTPATSLAIEEKVPVNRNALLRALIQELDGLYDLFLQGGYRGIREEWLDRSTVMGRHVRIEFQGSVMEGIVTGIDDFGALLLDSSDGSRERVMAGDVTVL